MDNNASIESLSIEIDSTVKDSSASINELIKLLKELKTNLQDTINASKNFKELKTNLSTSSIKASNISAPGKTKVSSGTSYGNIGSQLMDEKLGLNIGSEDELKRVATLKSRIVDVNGSIEKYITQNDKLVTVSKRTKDGIEQVKVSVKDLNDQTEKGTSIFSKFGSILGKGAKSFLALAGVNASWNSLKNYAEEASAYTEALNLFMVTMGENAKKGSEWVKKYTDALHLDPSDVMQYMGSFNSLVKGLGVGSDKAYLMSQNLTQLTYDLASFKNLSFETAFRKIQSGISGELEPLRNVGVALSQATLQHLAYSLGIQKNIKDMSEAEKAQLRYIQIMRSSSEWQTDMARTLMSPANAIRVIKQQFTLLARAIGHVLIPILMMAIPYVMVITEWLTKLANMLAGVLNKIFGIKLDFDYKRTSFELGGISDGIGDIGKSAGKAAKELNTMLAPFDDLNVVQNQLDKNGSGLGDDLGFGDLGVDLPTYDALEGLSEKFKENMDKARENLKKLLPILLTIAGLGLAKKLAPLLAFGPAGLIGKGLGYSTEQAGKLKNVFKKLAGLVLVGVGGYNFFTSMDDYINTTDDNMGNLKDSLIGLGELAVGVGLLISPIAALWTAAGGTVMILGGNLLKVLKEDVVAEKDVYENADTLTGKLREFFGASTKVSEETKKATKTITDYLQNTSKELDNLYLKKDIISDEDMTKFNDKINGLQESILNKLDEKRNKELADLKPLKAYTDPQVYQQMVDNINNFYDKQKTALSEQNQKIYDIMQKASSEHRNLTREEYLEIENIMTSYSKSALKQTAKNNDEYLELVDRLDSNLTSITSETASKLLKSAAKTRDNAIKYAKEQYNTVKDEAKKMKDAGTITKEQYDEMIQKAKDTKDSTINDANIQYETILNTVKKKLPNVGTVIDTETGKIKSNWQGAWDTITGSTDKAITDIALSFNDIPKTASKVIEDFENNFNGLDDATRNALSDVNGAINNWQPANIKTPHFDVVMRRMDAGGIFGGIMIPEITPRWYAEGGFPTSGDLFFANENGAAEMVGRIGNKTAVANNDQITTSITNAVVQGIANSGLDSSSKGRTIIYIGNSKVYEGYGEYASGENDRYGTNVIRI